MLIGTEDACKSSRCITRFAVGKLKMRVMPVTIRLRAGAGLNCNFCLRESAMSCIMQQGDDDMPNEKWILRTEFEETEHYRAAYTLFSKLKKAKERANQEGWVFADDVEKELGIVD